MQFWWAQFDTVTSLRLVRRAFGQNPIQASNVDTKRGRGRGAPERRREVGRSTAPERSKSLSLVPEVKWCRVTDNRIATTEHGPSFRAVVSRSTMTASLDLAHWWKPAQVKNNYLLCAWLECCSRNRTWYWKQIKAALCNLSDHELNYDRYGTILYGEKYEARHRWQLVPHIPWEEGSQEVQEHFVWGGDVRPGRDASHTHARSHLVAI